MLGIPAGQVPQRMSVPRLRAEWVTPARGMWVPVAPEFRGWGGPPATEFIAALMTHLNVGHYYVGWLSAAALFGATHHAPQVTHVATSSLVRERTVGRARLVFHRRERLPELPTVVRMARSGPYRVSTPEVTALDLASNITISGGLDNAATVITDLAEEAGLDEKVVAGLAEFYPDAAARRLGWIVERFTTHRLGVLAERVGRASAPSRLHPSRPLAGALDQRWGLRLNTTVEVE